MLIEIILPLSLAFIMFSLGLGLTFADFARILTMPKAVLTGMLGQILLLPALAYALVTAFGLTGGLAFGIMLLSFCPGGVTSNILTKLGGGTVALSITLTAIVSLLSVLTVPLLTGWAANTFLGEAAPEINVTSIAVAMFLITALPVLLGLLFRHFLPKPARHIDRVVSLIAALLFAIIVLAALLTNWDLFLAHAPKLGPVLIALNLLLLLVGVALAKLMGLTGPDALCIAVEMGVQNATLGITVAGLIAGAAGIHDYAIPSAVYGILMYLVTLPVIFALKARMA